MYVVFREVDDVTRESQMREKVHRMGENLR